MTNRSVESSDDGNFEEYSAKAMAVQMICKNSPFHPTVGLFEYTAIIARTSQIMAICSADNPWIGELLGQIDRILGYAYEANAPERRIVVWKSKEDGL